MNFSLYIGPIPTNVMPGHKPIFATLIVNLFMFLRDSLYKAVLEPSAPSKRRAKRIKENKKNKSK